MSFGPEGGCHPWEGLQRRVFERNAENLGIPAEDLARALGSGTRPGAHHLGSFVGIYDVGGRVFGDAKAWLNTPNDGALFQGVTPLTRILRDPMSMPQPTRDHLIAAPGGWG
jgi:hypothetical protein